MIDINEVKKVAEEEFRKEQMEEAKEKIKDLLYKKAKAQQVLHNIEREITDAYAELGQGSII